MSETSHFMLLMCTLFSAMFSATSSKDSGNVIVTSGMGFVRRPGFDEHTGRVFHLEFLYASQ